MRAGSVFVVTASLAGLIPMESDPLYVLTKHAVVGYARSMAPVLEPRGIRINLVCPGIVRTPMTEAAQAELDAAGFPLMEPEQIAEAIAARRPQRGDGPGVGLPARPRAAQVQVPERPRPAGRGRRGHGPAALTVHDGTCRGQDPSTSARTCRGQAPDTSRADMSL